MGKRGIAALLAALTILLALTGCGRSESSSDSAAGQGKVYYLNFKPEQKDQWEALAKEYTRQTGVKVNVVTAASGGYESTLKAEIAKSDPPTLFLVNGPVGLSTWKDYCYDLSDSEVYRQLKSEEFAMEEDGQVLAVAYAIETYGLIYNKDILRRYCQLEGAVISDASQIQNFETLKAVAEDMQSRREELGIEGAFASSGMDSSSDWRFKTHLANIPLYYEYRDEGITSAAAVKGTYLENFRNIWDLYLNNSTVEPSLISSKTGDDAASEFALGEACFYQNGTWAYEQISGYEVADEDIGMLPIYIGVEGEEDQGLVTGSENYWCVNKKAAPQDIQATLDFLEWVITSDEGRQSLAQEMGFVTPFKTFGEEYTPDNPLVKAAEEYIQEGKTSIGWYFTTMPSDQWKNDLGAAMLEYAQGTGDWDKVKTAFVEGWASEYQARQ